MVKKTFYAACLARLGLSQAEAAALHGSRLDTVKNWATGRRTPPAGVWDDLRKHEARIVERSETIREIWEDTGEPRDLTVQTHGEPLAMMAAADFFLSTDADPPISIILVN